MFIKKKLLKAQKKSKKLEIMCSNAIISVFLGIRKFADFFVKNNADASRTQVVFHVIYIFYGYSLGKVHNCAKCHHCRICKTYFREVDLFSPLIH